VKLSEKDSVRSVKNKYHREHREVTEIHREELKISSVKLSEKDSVRSVLKKKNLCKIVRMGIERLRITGSGWKRKSDHYF